MVENLSAEEVREKHIRDMGPELGVVFNALWNDVAWLHAKWNVYRQLYALSPERIDLLNEVAGFFFGVLQRTMLEDILLHLTRLTDSRKSVGKDNLTLQRIPELVTDETLASKLKSLTRNATEACEAPRSWRNRRLAHTDLTLALATSCDPLPGVSRADVETALRAVRDILNSLEAHYWQSETGYQYFGAKGGVDCLVDYLLKGKKAEERRMERIRQGKWLIEDLERADEI